PQDFRDVDFGRGSYSVLRRGRDDEGGGVIYGVSDEESRLNVNVATAAELTKIQDRGSDVATAITGWRTRGGSVAESDYYLSLKPPYQPRGGPFQTVRELLMVRGVTPDLFFGRDRHQNGLLDDLAEDMHDPAKYQDTVAGADLGWAHLFTVDSSVKNVNAAGQDRVNIQTADESSLANIPGLTRRLAHTIVS